MDEAITRFLVGAQSRPIVGVIAHHLLRILGVSIPRTVLVGDGLSLAHGAVGLVVHEDTVLGARVKLYQGVTLGRSDVHSVPEAHGGRVIVGDDVVIGANAVVLFRSGQVLNVGTGAVVGAGSVLLQSVGEGEVWAGNPARKVGERESW